MPWNEINAEEERHRFIKCWLAGHHSMSELCAHFGVSRKAGYKWRDRHASEGLAGLAERSHAPHEPAHATAPDLVERIVQMKLARPYWGPRKILDRLRDLHPDQAWPSDSTGDAILRRHGLVEKRRVGKRAAVVRMGSLIDAVHPNRLWAVDHKGWIRLGDGSRCEPLTITDGFSRYLIGVFATTNVCEAQARPCFERAFREHGLPEAIRSDNGSPFASAGVTGLTQLSVWWTKLGITHERIDPGRPQQNGAHERFHATLLREAMRPTCANAQGQARRFETFRHEYNEERSHEAIGRKPPARVYSTSPRQMPRRLPEPDYPAEAALRKVRSNGEIKWRGDLIGVSTALAGEWVCVEETEAGAWKLRFYDRTLAYIDHATNKLRSPHPYVTQKTEPESPE
jgi:transposase InsO family protein